MPTGDDALPLQLVKLNTRVTILYLLGGQFLFDSSNNKVKLIYLPFLTRFGHMWSLKLGLSCIIVVVSMLMLSISKGCLRYVRRSCIIIGTEY